MAVTGPLSAEQKLLNRLSRINKKYLRDLHRENHRHDVAISKIEAVRHAGITNARLAK